MKALAPALALLASGCVVGPRYHTPAPPAATGFTPEPPVLSARGAPAQTVTARPIPANWWRAFGSAKLDALVSEALAHSPTIAAARAALRQAHEQQLAVNGQLLPQLEVNPNYQRGKQSNELQPPINGGSQSYSIVTAGAQVTFNPDVFGGLRSARAQSRAQADVARAELAAARLTVLGNVVAQAVLHAGLTAQLAEQAGIIADYERTVAIGREQQREGQISGADLAAFQAQLASARGALPPLDRARVLARDQLAVLTGHTPDRPPADLPMLDELHLPTDLPLVVPSTLVEARPDIAQAAANLRAATGQVGVALAARLPLFNITAGGGGAAQAFQRVFQNDNLFWSVIAGFTAPLFDFATLRHSERAARAGLDAAREQYRGAVLTGLGNVADSLEALAADARAIAAAELARAAAAKSLAAAQLQLRNGQVAAPVVLAAQAADATARVQLAQAQAARLSDTAALYVAMGGGPS